jgi:hypothetical protein
MHSGNWWDVIAISRAGLGSIFLLIAPFASLLGLTWLWLLWAPVFFHSILTQVRMLETATRVSEKISFTPIEKVKVTAHILTAWLGMAGGLVDSLLPRRRQNW